MRSAVIQPRPAISRRHIFAVMALLVGAVGVGLLVVLVSMSPPARDLRDIAALLAASVLVSFVAYLAMLRFLPSRPLAGAGGRVVALSLFGGALALVNVLITAAFMFLNSHDLTLLAGLLLFALLVSSFLALSVARSITDPIAALIDAVDDVQGDARLLPADARGVDEIARLDSAFKAMAQRLEQAAAERERAEASRLELVAAISHDLRTPISSARLMVEAIADGVLDAATEQRYVSNIRAELVRLDHLIDDLFELSRIEAGALTLDMSPTNVDVFVSEIVESVRTEAERRRVHLHSRIHPDIPLIQADPWALERALRNVVENAVRHTPALGDVCVEARRRGENVELLVIDSGPGIPPQDVDRIFEPFYRGDASRRRDGSGAGLGLAIARGIVQAHDGSIELEPNSPHGCTFRVTLPITV